MTDINKVILFGRVTKDIDNKAFGYISTGTAKLTFSIAVNKSVKKGDQWENETSFFDILVWGKLAESLKEKLYKGRQLAIVGALKQDRWEKDGQKFSRVSVVADTVQVMAEGKKSDSSSFEPKEEASSPDIQESNDIPF